MKSSKQRWLFITRILSGKYVSGWLDPFAQNVYYPLPLIPYHHYHYDHIPPMLWSPTPWHLVRESHAVTLYPWPKPDNPWLYNDPLYHDPKTRDPYPLSHDPLPHGPNHMTPYPRNLLMTTITWSLTIITTQWPPTHPLYPIPYDTLPHDLIPVTPTLRPLPVTRIP